MRWLQTAVKELEVDEKSARERESSFAKVNFYYVFKMYRKIIQEGINRRKTINRKKIKYCLIRVG